MLRSMLVPLGLLCVLMPWFMVIIHLTWLVVTRIPHGGAM